MYYMHVHGMGAPEDLARRVKPAVDLIDQAVRRAAPPAPSSPAAPGVQPVLDAAALATIVGTAGEQNGAVYKITVGRPDIDLREHGARISSRMARSCMTRNLSS